MNHAYRLVWSDRLSAYVPAPEFARCRGKRSSNLRALSAAVLASLAVTAHALPGGGHVSAGQGSIAQSGSAMTVTQQSPRLAINWQSFGIGVNESVTFAQPSASAIALNRVLGSDPSQILGRLSANGQVWILNPNGLLFGSSAQINVGGLVGSTLQVNDADFLAGKTTFSGNGGTVTNQGNITAADGGYVALFGGRVSNEGVIQAKLGTVALGAGKQVTLDFVGVQLLNLQVDQGAVNALVQNKQLIQADGGTVLLTAKAADALLNTVVNNEGIIEARTIDTSNGTIKLLGGMDGGTVQVSGTLDASAPNGGNGGFIETSGAHVKVADSAVVTTAAPAGHYGTWLIDPQDYTVAPNGGDMTGTLLSTDLGTSNVTLQSSSGGAAGSGNVNVNDGVSWNANTTLTLTASNNVNFNNASITGTGLSSGLVLNANAANGAETARGTGSVNIANSFVNVGGAVAVTGTNLNVGSASATGSAQLQGGSVTASMSGNINVIAGTGTGSSASIQSNGTMYLVATGVVVQGGGSGSNNAANIFSNAGDQSFIVGSGGIQVLGGVGGANNTASISQNDPLGTQTIVVTGGDVSVLGGAAGNSASAGIYSNGTAQSITLTNSNNLSVIAAAGGAGIGSNGAQTISLTGTGANAIQVGGASDAQYTSINANGAQSVTAGANSDAHGSITVIGGNVASNPVTGGADANISSGTTQTISTAGVLSLTGGSATTVGTSPCYDEGVCVSINNGSGLQSISAQGIVLQGGPTGDYNMVNIGGDSQSFTVGSGGIQIIGGVGGSNNNANINGNSQSLTVGSGGIQIIGGAGGSNNNANIDGGNSQIITVGGGNISLVGGAGTANDWAQIVRQWHADHYCRRGQRLCDWRWRGE